MTSHHQDLIDRKSIYDEVDNELETVFERFGEQNWPLSPNDKAGHYHQHEHERKANMWKGLNDQRVTDKRLAWDGIVLEEVHEAFAEIDPAKARAELIQAAAMCIATIESIDRAEAAEAP